MKISDLLEKIDYWEIELDIGGGDDSNRREIEDIALKLARQFKCVSTLVKHDGPAGGASVFTFTGPKKQLEKLVIEYDGGYYDEDDPQWFENRGAYAVDGPKKQERSKLLTVVQKKKLIMSHLAELKGKALGTHKIIRATLKESFSHRGNLNVDVFVTPKYANRQHPYGDPKVLSELNELLMDALVGDMFDHISWSESGLQGYDHLNVDLVLKEPL